MTQSFAGPLQRAWILSRAQIMCAVLSHTKLLHMWSSLAELLSLYICQASLSAWISQTRSKFIFASYRLAYIRCLMIEEKNGSMNTILLLNKT